MEKIKLTIPSQQDGQHILVETNPAKLEDWIRGLPLADMSKTLPELTRAIASLNRADLPYKQRSELVDYFDQAYTLIHDFFRPKRSKQVNKVSNLNQNDKKLQALTKEMAFAHKIIVNDSIGKKTLWGKNKHLTLSSNMAIYYLGIMLIEQYEVYAPVPMYLWREINSIYANAGKKGFNTTKMDLPKCYCLPTIEQSYIRNCLLALSDPYHLAQSEHWYLFHHLHKWNYLSRISENPDDFSQSNCFIIDISSEHKPNFVTSELDDPEDPKIRLLLTGDLIRQIKFDLERLEEKNVVPENTFHPSIKPAKAKHLWTHVSKHWREKIKRASKRYPIVSKIDAVWGLEDVSRVIARLQQNKNNLLSVDEIISLTRLTSPEQLRWDAINVSTNGIGLCSRHYMLPHINLGDIVLLREYMNNKPAPHWRLAICRWYTGEQQNGTLLGLEYIDGKVTPVRLILNQGNNEHGGQIGIVISPTNAKSTEAPSIIAQNGAYKSKSYAMLGFGEAVEVRPRMQIESTDSVDRFFYQTFELKKEIAEEIEKDDLDVIPWTSVPHEKGNLDDSFDTPKQESEITLDNIVLPGDH